ncbi:hypothetical protein ABZ915_16965 [Streptomyces sp. NPDC046915]|uniref:hypothetical protein n=1 Tax=Streptomyces sp. NPDC046915 TaxID=3155257 RepID=UPI0033E082E3
MSRGHADHEAIEQRLRDALSVRADSVELRHLRPPALPAVPSRSLLPSRPTVMVLLGLAAAALCVLLAVMEGGSGTPVQPSDTPSFSPTPSTSPYPAPASPVVPAPS